MQSCDKLLENSQHIQSEKTVSVVGPATGFRNHCNAQLPANPAQSVASPSAYPAQSHGAFSSSRRPNNELGFREEEPASQAQTVKNGSECHEQDHCDT